MMLRRAWFLGVAGVLAVSASFFAVGAPSVAATFSVKPGLHSRLASRTQPPTQAECVVAFTVPCYQPSQIQTAYNEGPLFSRRITGAGETIVIVDAFGSPTIQSDLATSTRSLDFWPRHP
jgi:subtilase family serine protease